MEELNRVISELSITDGPGDNISYNKEGPIPISVIHDKETVIRDAYVDMELGLPRVKYDSLMHAIVKQRKLDDNGNIIGTESTNSLVDMRAYALKFIDGTTETLKTNTNAENLLAQVGEEGHRQHLLDEIIDYRRIIMRSTKVMHSLRIELEVDDKRKPQKDGKYVCFGKMIQPIG